MGKEVIIIGAGGHGKVIADIIKKNGDTVLGFLDDNTEAKDTLGCVCDCVKHKDKYFIIAIGNNKIRKAIAEEYKELKYYTAIHPSAVIADDVKIGCGTAVMANSVINASAVIGKHCIINTAAVIEHDNVMGDFVHVSPNAALCGTVMTGDSCHIGAGAVIKNNVSVAADTVIGVGGAVVSDITVKGTYIGVPVKRMQK